MSIGEVIASRRRELGLSQRQLAARLGEVSGSPTLTRHEVSRWERGARQPARYWRRWLAVVLAVDATLLALPAIRPGPARSWLARLTQAWRCR